MILSLRHRFLFIHVPKTGGTSIEQALLPWADRPEERTINRVLARLGIHVNHYLGPIDCRRFRKHQQASTVRSVLGSTLYETLFSFAFVRNPWDALVSRYCYIRQAGNHHGHRRVTRLASFAQFVTSEVVRRKPPQSAWLLDDDDRPLVRFIGRFEQLDDGFQQICRELNLRAKLPRFNRTQRADYRHYYDDTTAQLVATYWSRDIARFGYRFDPLDRPAIREHPGGSQDVA